MLSEAGVYVSTGSACSTKKLEESHVLRALGVPEDYIHGSIRITLSHENTLAQAQYALESIKKNVRRLREMSPFN